MSRVTLDIVDPADFDLSSLLRPNERLLWTGQPQHGLQLLQLIGAERKYLKAKALGLGVLWASLPLIVLSKGTHPILPAIVFSLASLAFIWMTIHAAKTRQRVLSQVFYAVTTERAVICRRRRDWRRSEKVYVVSNPLSNLYPYAIMPTKPYPSLKIGTLIDSFQLNMTGLGLAHPGQPWTWGKSLKPLVFEQISEADHVLSLIRSQAR